jgi:uncharacterized metal-binding protein YceD (DUF177 family)
MARTAKTHGSNAAPRRHDGHGRPAAPEAEMEPSPLAHAVALEGLPRDEATPVALAAAEANLAAIARFIGVERVEALAFEGRVRGWQAHGWRVTGRVTARVVQSCVVTLEPVEAAIEAELDRTFLPVAELPEAPEEVELTEDSLDAPDPLGDAIEIGALVLETLALELDPYPRAADAAFGARVYAAPGVEPLTDEAMRPFAGLAELKERLERKDD